MIAEEQIIYSRKWSIGDLAKQEAVGGSVKYYPTRRYLITLREVGPFTRKY